MCPGSTSIPGEVGIRGHCIFRFTRLVSVVVALPFLLVQVLNVFSLSLFWGLEVPIVFSLSLVWDLRVLILFSLSLVWGTDLGLCFWCLITVFVLRG